jgi:excinuclease ABC subunit C
LYSVLVLPLDAELEFSPTAEEQFFSSIPSYPGVFLIEPRPVAGGAEAKPYVAKTADLQRAAERLLRLSDGISKRLNLRQVAARFRYRKTGSRFEQSLALYGQARERFPGKYRDILHLRPAALLKINLRNPYPRCYVTRRILADGCYYFGPFVSRQSAESFANQFLDLFKIRRCQIKIRRDPSFPGCIYSEMKMCLAPCFAGCSKEEYDVEVGRVLESLESQGASLSAGVEREREAASEALDFERAAALHKKIEKISGILRGLPDIAGRVNNLHAVVIQRATQENTIALFRILGGLLAEPLFLDFDPQSSQPRSAEESLRRNFAESNAVGPGAISAAGESADPDRLREATTQREEHLSILARWYYSNPREGEILFRGNDWPYRKILRACARVLAEGKAAS